jgi:hypothetical protein
VETAVQSIPFAHVQRIETRDSILNGARNGAIFGAAGLGGFGAYLSHALCEISDGCFRQDLVPILAMAGLGAGIGIAGGSAIDYLVKGRRVVYTAADGPSRSVRVSPMFRKRGIGVRFTIRWTSD